MNNKFDELAIGMAQTVTRRGALKKFGAGLAGIALAAIGMTNNAQADPAAKKGYGNCNHCVAPYGCSLQDQACLNFCTTKCFGKGGGGGSF